jgi:hypothetical protein
MERLPLLLPPRRLLWCLAVKCLLLLVGMGSGGGSSRLPRTEVYDAARLERAGVRLLAWSRGIL